MNREISNKEFGIYSRLALEKTIEYLQKKEKYTTSHPETNTFIIRPKTMARIIKHGGNMQATVPEEEYKMFIQILRYLQKIGNIESIYNNSGYSFNAEECNGNNHYGIKIKKIYKIDRRGGLCLSTTSKTI